MEKNYWSDYNGTDNNGDGIGDTSYLTTHLRRNYPRRLLIDSAIRDKDDPRVPLARAWIILQLFLTATFVIVFFRKRLKKVIKSGNYL